MALLITIVDFIIVGVAMIILAPLGIGIFLLRCLGFRKLMAQVIYKIAQVWSLMLIACTGCKISVQGKEHIPLEGGLCFVSNHSSIFDILVILALVGRPVGFIAKKELAWIPFLNIWIFLLGGLFIDRKDIRKAIGTINKGIHRIKQGEAVMIFPEGTRSKGRGLLPFRSGSFKLATQSGSPILPIAITGSYEIFEKTHRIRAVPVRVTFLPPINTAELPPADRRQYLSDQVYDLISEALQAQEFNTKT
ncbi:MAG: 1-acyl-sn-glycerol-3-phosphate acyltransferase [Treponema sp.]|jgi:1-acyl-sn-glycerol-3-phosphate acyltransferase|nr:1-acyl-sn-glycerol-3-phosphate acyltransferase [Treponema sp.]